MAVSSTDSLLATYNRPALLDKLAGETFDLLVVGGGITGAGIALDAVSRGLSVALVEKADFGSGTSSRSTKLIHGGLRYLKQFDFGLVREVCRERAIIHRNAPHLVIPEKMLLPVLRGGNLSLWSVAIALWIYDFLAGVKKSERKKMLSPTKTVAAEPLLADAPLKGSGIYTEYRTDDARLVIEVIKTAVKLGARCLNYGLLTGFLYQNNRIAGGRVREVIARKGRLQSGQTTTPHQRGAFGNTSQAVAAAAIHLF